MSDRVGHGPGRRRSRASCIAGFNWNGRLYARDAGELDKQFELAEELGLAVEPACNDMRGGTEPLARPVTVVRIKGVDPASPSADWTTIALTST